MGRWTADRRRLKRALLAVVVLLILCLGAVFWQYRQSLAPVRALTNIINDGATLAMDHIEHTAIRDGRVQWRLKASSAALVDDSRTLLLSNPVVVFFTEDGRSIHMTAKQGRLNTESNDLDVSGQVVLQDAAYRFSTEKIQYRHQENRIVADQPVTIDGGWATLTADTMTIDLTTRQAVFSGTIQGEIRDGLS